MSRSAIACWRQKSRSGPLQASPVATLVAAHHFPSSFTASPTIALIPSPAFIYFFIYFFIPLPFTSSLTEKKKSRSPMTFRPSSIIYHLSSVSSVSSHAPKTHGKPPRTPQRSRRSSVARIWARLLKVDESTILASSDFFDLGGHSLLLAKLSAALLKDTGVKVAIQAIIERPTLAELAELLEEEMTSNITATSSQGKAAGHGGGATASVVLSTPAMRYVQRPCAKWRRVDSTGCSL